LPVALVLAFLITFIAAAPVPTGNIAPLSPPHTSLSHRIPHSNSRSSQASLDITQTHADNQVLPSVPITVNGDPLAARELVFLERRRFNLFSKIRNAFKVRAFILEREQGQYTYLGFRSSVIVSREVRLFLETFTWSDEYSSISKLLRTSEIVSNQVCFAIY
jgi:hypothetical protein